MALKSSADVAFFLLGGRSVLSSGITSISESHESVLEQIDGLGDSDDKWGAVGVRKFEMSQEGFFDRGTGSLHEALETADPQVLMYAGVGNVIGDMILALNAVRTDYSVLPARHEFHKAKASYKANLGPERLGKTRLAAPLTARTAATGETTGDDWDEATTLGGAVYLGVSALTLDAATNLTITVEDSANNADWETIATFTAVTVAPAAERVAVTGTIRRYTRVTWEFTDAPGGSQTATFAVGIGRI